MNKTIKTGLAILLLAISCTKENTSLQSPFHNNITMDAVTVQYNSVRIGTQRWMTTNLDVTHYRNGDKIPQVKRRNQWDTLTTGAWCWYNNDSATGAVYGKLYNWYAVNDPRGLAPTGWHVPTDAEWDTLSSYLGNNAGGKLKDTGTVEAGTGLWYAPNTKANNKTAFKGLPGGFRYYADGKFINIGYYGIWWSSSESINNNNDAWHRFLAYNTSSLDKFTDHKRTGYSVRCIKD